MSDYISREEIEEAKQEEMRDLLMDAFSGHSVIFEIYSRRGWLERLFTPKILLMDTDALYTTQQVADICETQAYVIKNKRRELLDYLNPTVLGDGSTKIYKHNYISVFKMKMILGLTGEGSEYTIPQLKEIISGGVTRSNPSNGANESSNELLLKVLQKLENFEKFERLIESDEFFLDIEKRVKQTSQQLLLEDSKIEAEAKQSAIDLYEKILSSSTTISDKELFLVELSSLESKYPQHAYTIKLYKTSAEDKILRFKQDEKELKVLNLKHKVNELFEEYDRTKNEAERDTVREKIKNLANENPDLSFEIRLWLSSAGQKKKGFFKRLFS
ncbi:hypothetical protein ABEW19_29815 [Paenibacillus illinoisensis]|uniref:hypothetical protein n=1 Tax=Paenibacillus illinoisensis TaxID=59845 RepID=UPI003015BFD7